MNDDRGCHGGQLPLPLNWDPGDWQNAFGTILLSLATEADR